MFSELQTKAAPELKEQLVELFQSELVPEMQQNRSVTAEALDGYAGGFPRPLSELKEVLFRVESCWDILHPLCCDGAICDLHDSSVTKPDPRGLVRIARPQKPK